MVQRKGTLMEATQEATKSRQEQAADEARAKVDEALNALAEKVHAVALTERQIVIDRANESANAAFTF